ncbi:alpha-hydroxy-acid oxidizing protein [Allopusillimonas soli]|uniref:Alpha-hydroxy-acid oxidizing protein n=1 Tax=Allopusillimonas soli TaxID=659016 RepID=A0A853F8E4_9BURK|nr:alpha-hydroxy acid oxidase [Allopusillimonas soli]NYT36257.1 alpha-hydroxy-acid oxidizing protein [Allopusillimonas soli]TEA76582.1 alpha-hydroxy-acid oxidizing protein [Allopusillimonas soli]
MLGIISQKKLSNANPHNDHRNLPRPLRKILCLNDFENAACRRLPRPIFGYVSGAVEDGRSLLANFAAFDQWALVPRVLINVSARNQATELLGRTYAHPFGIAPMGISALSAYEGDLVLARAAEQRNIPMIMSGASLIKMEEIAQSAPQSAWFQAYVPGEMDQIALLVKRVKKAGFSTLVLTVDTATLANRENNVRAGFSSPLRPSLRLGWDGVSRPRWLLGTLARTLLTRGLPHFENSGADRGVPVIARKAVRQFGHRDHLCWEHVRNIRDLWPGKLILKGILSANDAKLASEHGVDGIIVSNHGGRQLDGAAAPLKVLPEIIEKKGNMAVMLDSGFRRGTDIMKALSLGADFVFIGRPFLYAAAVAGEVGVNHAVQLLADEIHRNMALLGISSLAELNQDFLITT